MKEDDGQRILLYGRNTSERKGFRSRYVGGDLSTAAIYCSEYA